MRTWHEIEQCRSALVRQMHAVWNAKRRGDSVPLRSDIDPAELKPLLPNLLIVDLEQQPFRIRYRLVGTKVVAASGYDFTGRYLDEMSLASGAGQWESYYRTVRDTERPLFGAMSLATADGGRFTYDFAIFPVTTDGERVNQCIDVEDYGDFNRRLSELQEKIEHWRPPPITTTGGSGEP